MFEAGDGNTRGSCKSLSHKCYPDGGCSECKISSDCSRLSDTCTNGKCRCGSNLPCNPIKSNICTNGVCYCGIEENGCHTEDKYYPDKLDPKNPSVLGLQRSKNEVCEKISDYYNPKFIPNHPLMVNGLNEDGTTKYEIDYADNKGNYTGTYQCLGMLLALNFHTKCPIDFKGLAVYNNGGNASYFRANTSLSESWRN